MAGNVIFKIIVLGDESVGKTCLIQRFTDGVYNGGSSQTIGVDFSIKNIEVNGAKVKLQIWDFGGQKYYRTIQYSLCDGAKGFILVFDLSNPSSLDSIPSWISFIRNCSDDNAPVILVGAKSDIKRDSINSKISKQILDEKIIGYFETSAKENISVQPPFYFLAKKMIESWVMVPSR